MMADEYPVLSNAAYPEPAGPPSHFPTMSRIARIGSAILSNFFGMDIKRFKDRMHAGKLLAKRLEAYARRPDVIVLALPRGGVPIGFAVAKALEVPLDVMLVRKLGVPGHEELAMGAVASGGQLVLAPDVVQMLGIPDEIIEAAARRELAEIERREKLYRSGRPPLQLKDRVVILVDDGLATGSTMLAAIQAVRAENPARVVVAVPVGAPDTCRKLSREADEVICLRMPEPFYAVGQWYENFAQTTDEEVIRLLDQAWKEQADESRRSAGSQQDHEPLRDDG
jgi:putative phosphoribosyl transferase